MKKGELLKVHPCFCGKKNAIKTGVELIASGVNTYDGTVRKELKYAFSTVHSTLLNLIAFELLKAVADRSEHDDRFHPIIKEVARLFKKATSTGQRDMIK